MSTISTDRFGPAPVDHKDAGLETDDEMDERFALVRSEARLKEHGPVFQVILDAFEAEYGWDGMPDCVKEVAEELRLI